MANGGGRSVAAVAEEVVGTIPDGWKYATLRAACEMGGGDIQTGPFGSQLHASDYVEFGVPSIMPQNIGDNRVIEDGIARISLADAKRLSRYLVRPGDVVYSRRGDVERRALIGEREEGWLCGTGCLRVRFGDGGVDPRYASYYLGHPSVRQWIVRHAHGATMPNLNTSILASCPFVIPPIDEQHAIAHILSTLDDKIELNRRMNETLEGIARAVFKSWFVDFDPVHARMEGRQPIGMPREVAQLFPDRLKGSAVGKIPEGWTAVAIPDAFEVNPARQLRRGKVAPYLDMANMPTRGHTPDVVIDRAFGSGMRFVNGDTLIARITPCLENGKTAYVDFLQDGQVGWGSTEYIVLRPKRPVPSEFAYCLARSDEFREFAVQNMTGSSGRQRVSAEALSHYLLVLPSEGVTELFGRIVRPMFELARREAEESRALMAVRDALLPKLISGEFRLEVTEA